VLHGQRELDDPPLKDKCKQTGLLTKWWVKFFDGCEVEVIEDWISRSVLRLPLRRSVLTHLRLVHYLLNNCNLNHGHFIHSKFTISSFHLGPTAHPLLNRTPPTRPHFFTVSHLWDLWPHGKEPSWAIRIQRGSPFSCAVLRLQSSTTVSRFRLWSSILTCWRLTRTRFTRQQKCFKYRWVIISSV